MSYNCQKDKWTINELISYCVQEEERLRKVSLESANVATNSQNKGTKKRKKNAAVKHKNAKKQDNDKGKQPASGSRPVGKEVVCFFCKGEGHYKKQCANYQQWLKKKGTLVSLVCSKVNTVSVPIDTWWIDSGATTHVSVSMQGCLSHRKPTDVERYIYSGDGGKAHVEAIEHFRILLCTGFYLDLYETFVVSSFRRNFLFTV